MGVNHQDSRDLHSLGMVNKEWECLGVKCHLQEVKDPWVHPDLPWDDHLTHTMFPPWEVLLHQLGVIQVCLPLHSLPRHLLNQCLVPFLPHHLVVSRYLLVVPHYQEVEGCTIQAPHQDPQGCLL